MATRKAVAAGAVAVFLGLLFLVLFVPVILQTWNATTASAGNEAYVALATGVAGYVAGIIALWFGVQAGNRLVALGGRLAPGASETTQTIVAALYIGAYFGVALVAAYLLVTKTSVIPAMLIAQCTAAAGLAFAIGTKLFSDS